MFKNEENFIIHVSIRWYLLLALEEWKEKIVWIVKTESSLLITVLKAESTWKSSFYSMRDREAKYTRDFMEIDV